MSPSESSRSSSAILSTTSSGSTRQSGLGGNIEWESFNEMRQMDSFRLSGRWLLDRKQQWGEKVESYRAGDFYWGKKRIKTSLALTSRVRLQFSWRQNKQKRVSNNSHLGEGTISATAILTSPPSHLRSSRSSLTTTATVILTSRPPPLLRSRPHISSSSLTIILLTSPPRSLSP